MNARTCNCGCGRSLELEAVAASPRKVGRPPDKRGAAAEWLTTYLAGAGKPVRASTIQALAQRFRISTKTLRRAAEDMGVVKAPPGGGPGCTWWLPAEVLDRLGLADESERSDCPHSCERRGA